MGVVPDALAASRFAGACVSERNGQVDELWTHVVFPVKGADAAA
jgi:hypothetical protein